MPLGIPPRSTVTGRHTLYLEDLDVAPGDFITYYVRARDLARGKRAERSAQRHLLSRSEAVRGGVHAGAEPGGDGRRRGNPQLDDLVAAQKEIIVATWKLDRRSASARARSRSRTSARCHVPRRELKTRVEETSSAFRESNMRDPRRPSAAATGRGPRAGPPTEAPRAGQTLPEEDAMTRPSTAMGKAVGSLERAENVGGFAARDAGAQHLLKAQADVKQRQVQRQQAGRRRRQPCDGGSVEPVRQGTGEAPADQLRERRRAPSRRKTRTRRRRPHQGTRAAPGRTRAQAAGVRAQSRTGLSEEELKRELEKPDPRAERAA